MGHATRCIPIIKALIDFNFEPIIASDGNALALLKKEFPDLKTFELPSYNITYSKKGNYLKWKLLQALPHILKTIKREKLLINQLVTNEKIDGIISDNRFGVYHKSIPSVYITHQLRVLSGNSTWLTSKIHQKIIKKFTQCWIPDFRDQPNLSGTLGHTNHKLKTVKYIGPLSRFKKQNIEETIDILVILSGPEPQRTLFEEKLHKELKTYKGSVTMVLGLVDKKQTISKVDNITICNYMNSNQLETAINRSKLIVSRSGYTSIMDLAKLGKKAIFIPTSGQFEQEYLAKKLAQEFKIPSYNQNEFTINNLKFDARFSGFEKLNYKADFEELFSLF